MLVIDDRYQSRPPRPFAPGGEIAGVVQAVGTGVTGVSPGDRVIGMVGHGDLAEKVAVDGDRLYPLPDGRGFTEGAALLLTHATAIHALRSRAARGGSVAAGAGRAGRRRRLVRRQGARGAREAGADDTLVYGRAPFDRDGSMALADRFKAAGGRCGFDVILDPVGGDHAEPALRSIGWEGRYLVVGFPAGIPRLPLNLALLKGCDVCGVCGVFWGAFAARDPAATVAHVERFALWAAGRIMPRVARLFPFDRAGGVAAPA